MKNILLYSFLGISLLALAFAAASYYGAAQYTPENYFFFMQYYAKLFEKDLVEYAPFTGGFYGHNIIFMEGNDGAVGGLHKGIHIEPLKYIISLIYFIFQSPLLLFFLFILVFYSPLLYGAFVSEKLPKDQARLLAAALILYAIYPGAAITAITALRPMVFFYPMIVLFIISIIWKRPLFERLIFLNLLLAVREDSIFLALGGIAYQFFKEWKEGSKHKESGIMTLNWSLWLIAEALYFYSVSDAFRFYMPTSQTLRRVIDYSAGHISLTLVVISAAALLAAAIVYFVLRSKLWQRPHFGTFLFISFPVISTLGLLSIGWSSFPWSPHFIYGRMGMLIFTFSILFFLILSVEGSGKWKMGWWKIALPAAGAIFILLGLYGSFSPIHQFREWRKEAPAAKLLFEARSKLGKHDGILVDQKTSQFFYDYGKVIVYNGFAKIEPGIPIFRPSTPDEFKEALRSVLSYAVIEKNTLKDIEILIKEAGVKFREIEGNERFVLYAVEKL